MDNQIKICSKAVTVVAVTVIIAFAGWRAHCAIQYVMVALQHESQFKEDQEVLTSIRTWCEQKTANVRESHENELVQLHAECEAHRINFLKYLSGVMENRTKESEKRISNLENELNKTEERTKDCHIEYKQIVSKLVDDNKEELERERSLFDSEINKREQHTMDYQTECEQRVSELVDDNENQLIKQQNEYGTKINYLNRELHETITVLRETINAVNVELEMFKIADSEKGIRDHAFNLYQSIVCYPTIVPNELCRRSRQQNV